MGGFGSGRWRNHTKKRLVEDSLAVDIRDLPHSGICFGVHDTVPVTDSSGNIQFRCAGRSIPIENMQTAVSFQIMVGKEIHQQTIPLIRPDDEGLHNETCFSCPVIKCDNRCRKLYLPLGERLFLCRNCHNLTYRKQQEHDPRVTRLIKDPDKLIQLLKDCDNRPQNFYKRFLLLRAGYQCLAALEAELPEYLLPVYQEFLCQRMGVDAGI